MHLRKCLDVAAVVAAAVVAEPVAAPAARAALVVRAGQAVRVGQAARVARAVQAELHLPPHLLADQVVPVVPLLRAPPGTRMR